MRVLTWNVNGLRAATRKGLSKWLDEIKPDVVLLQEIRCRPDQIEDDHPLHAWHALWNPAERPGYSGTAVFSKRPLKLLCTGIDGAADPEGRVTSVEVDGVNLISVYLPSGSSSPEAQTRKNTWMDQCTPWLAKLKRKRKPVIIGGDLNIARDERDIFHWKSNQDTSGFLPHEREWMNALIESGWSDLVREHYGDVDGPYSWWSNRGQARALNRGWRIDYLLANRSASHDSGAISIHREAGLACSDHAPVIVEMQ